MTAINPCKCGSRNIASWKEQEYHYGKYRLRYYILCLDCGNKTELYDTPKQAKQAWNEKT